MTCTNPETAPKGKIIEKGFDMECRLYFSRSDISAALNANLENPAQ